MLLSALRLATLGGIAYLGFALFRVTTYRRSRTNAGALAPPLTLLKPLCGLEPQLYENLCSFCDQEYPEFQVVFSAADAHDPALEVARAVASQFAGRDITVSADAASTRASNPKIANLLGAMPHAKHDILVVADSDMRVGRGYLAAVAGTFASARIGAATCLYRGRAAGGFAAALGAAFVNDQFAPSVLVATALQPMRFCFGSTMAVRREALEAIGGLEALGEQLADDYALGRLVAARGWTVEMAPYVVENVIYDENLAALWRHELRWARTIASLRPAGYALSIFSYGVPIALAYLFVAPASLFAWTLACAAAALRLTLHYAVRRPLELRDSPKPWLVPVRDLFGCAVWFAGLFGTRVLWRERRMRTRA